MNQEEEEEIEMIVIRLFMYMHGAIIEPIRPIRN